jgi:hypothetical protein
LKSRRYSRIDLCLFGTWSCQAEQVANDLQTFTNEATSEKPRRKWWELSAEGMKEAANTVGEIGVSVLETLEKISPILASIL